METKQDKANVSDYAKLPKVPPVANLVTTEEDKERAARVHDRYDLMKRIYACNPKKVQTEEE